MKLILIFILFPFIVFGQSLSPKRVANFKSAVVRILIEGDASGTGFFTNDNGLILTSWHVIEPALLRDVTGRVHGARKIEIEFSNGEKVSVGMKMDLLGQKYVSAVAYDYAFLNLLTVPKQSFTFLNLGDFNKVVEGEQVYSIGYPFGIKQQVISSGLFSTKWSDTARFANGHKRPRDVAWLDLTMNKGNSGGPIIQLGKTPEEDKVIGIATFILNPYAHLAKQFSDYSEQTLTKRGTAVELNGVDFAKVTSFFSNAIYGNSLGVSGCVSINYSRNH